MPVETRSRAKRLKRNDSSSVEVHPQCEHGASQGFLLDIGPDLLTLVIRCLDVEEFCALRMTHPAIYHQSQSPSTWSPAVGKKVWIMEMLRKLVARPLQERNIGNAEIGARMIQYFRVLGRAHDLHLAMKRELSERGDKDKELRRKELTEVEIIVTTIKSTIPDIMDKHCWIFSRMGVLNDLHQIEKMVLSWVRQGEEKFGELKRGALGWDITWLSNTMKIVKNQGAAVCVIGPFTVPMR